MYVLCKSCGNKIPVAGKPTGSTSMENVQTEGNVDISGGRISLGKGGKISLGKGGKISLGSTAKSSISCPDCGQANDYLQNDFIEE